MVPSILKLYIKDPPLFVNQVTSLLVSFSHQPEIFLHSDNTLKSQNPTFNFYVPNLFPGSSSVETKTRGFGPTRKCVTQKFVDCICIHMSKYQPKTNIYIKHNRDEICRIKDFLEISQTYKSDTTSCNQRTYPTNNCMFQNQYHLVTHTKTHYSTPHLLSFSFQMTHHTVTYT